MLRKEQNDLLTRTGPGTADRRHAGIALPRLDGEPGDGADRGQRLAAEAQRRNVEQVLVAELGGGVPLHRQREVGRAHAAAVVGDADEGEAARRRHLGRQPR